MAPTKLHLSFNSLVASSAYVAGNFHWTVDDVAKSIVCMMMSGPCLTGYTQVRITGVKSNHCFDI